MKDMINKALSVGFIIGASIIAAVIAIPKNRSAIKEIPPKATSMIRSILK